MKRRAMRVVLALMVVVLLGLGAAWWMAGELMAAAPRVIGPSPDDLPIEKVVLTSASGETIAGWHVDPPTSRGVVVLLHPIRTSRLAMLDRARWLEGLGYASLLIDLSSHGESTGDVISLGARECDDVRAAIAFAKEEHPGSPVGVIGVSLGGASALLAGPLDVDALVVESVYATIDRAVRQRVTRRLGQWSAPLAELLLVQIEPRLGIGRSALRPIDHIGSVGCPVLVVGGEDDEQTPAAETTSLEAAASDPSELFLIPGCAHVDLDRCAREAYRERVAAWLGRWMSPGARSGK